MPLVWTDYSDEVYTAIKTYLTAQWTATPIAWPNEILDTPANGPFIAIEIAGTLFGMESLGANVEAQNRWDESGLLWIHVMAPATTGIVNARGAAKALASLFRGQTLLAGDLEFMDASIGLGEPGDEEGTFHRISVSIEWRHWDA